MTPRQRFNSKITKTNRCWLWKGALANGHPTFKVDGRRVSVRQWAWPGPDETRPHCIGTSCGKRRCVRPAHLVAATSAGPKPRPPEADEIVTCVQEHGPAAAMQAHDVGPNELHDILDAYYGPRMRNVTQPRVGRPVYVPRHLPIDKFAVALTILKRLDELGETDNPDHPGVKYLKEHTNLYGLTA